MGKGSRKIRRCVLGVRTGSRRSKRLLGSCPKGGRPREDWYADYLSISYHFEFLTVRRRRGPTEIGFAPFEVTIPSLEVLYLVILCTSVDLLSCFLICKHHGDGSFSASCFLVHPNAFTKPNIVRTPNTAYSDIGKMLRANSRLTPNTTAQAFSPPSGNSSSVDKTFSGHLQLLESLLLHPLAWNANRWIWYIMPSYPVARHVQSRQDLYCSIPIRRAGRQVGY